MRDIRAGVLTALVGLVAAGGSLGADEVTGQGGKVGPVSDAVRDRLGLGDWYTQAAEAAERAHLRGFDPASGPAFNWDRLGDGGDKPGPG